MSNQWEILIFFQWMCLLLFINWIIKQSKSFVTSFWHFYLLCNEWLLWYDLCAKFPVLCPSYQVLHDVTRCVGMHETSSFTHRCAFTACRMAVSLCLTTTGILIYSIPSLWFLNGKVFGGVCCVTKYIPKRRPIIMTSST